MINDKDFSLLESYLEGTMTGDAKISFEERLRKEEGLSEYLSLIIESDAFLKEFDKQQKIEEWKKIVQDTSPQTVEPTKWLHTIRHNPIGKYAFRIAAMLLLFVAIYWFIPVSYNSPEQLASHYWSETANFSYADARRGDTPKNIENTVKKIYELHETGDYKAALNAIQELSVSDEKMTLLKGSCYYNLGETDSAIRTFQQIITLQNSYTEDEAKWYLALSYLKKGDGKMGIKELQEIIDRKLWNHKLAKVLLKKLS
ncbi:MAG: tetratricopeptide repeat protein [Chitinophagales bacterium]